MKAMAVNAAARWTLPLLVLVFAVLPVKAQSGTTAYELGIDPVPPRLLQSVKSAMPGGDYVAAASAASGANTDPAAVESRQSAGAVDLSGMLPEPGYQGRLGSCGAWATAYALKSYQENYERRWGTEDESHVFSPSFLYNLFSNGQDRGSHFPGLFALLENKGCATLNTMPYTENVAKLPSREALDEGKQYRIASYSRLDPENIEAIKTVVSERQPVVFGAMLYQDFLDYRGGVYRRKTSARYGGHGMLLIGYDDSLQAFKFINSWGTGWGEDGYGWMHYDTFQETVFEAYTVQDIVETITDTPEAPSEISASQGSFVDRVEVSWGRTGSPAYFEVYRSDNERGGFEKLAAVRGTVYRDEDALPGVHYLYAVKSIFVSAGGESAESALSSVMEGWKAVEDAPPGVPQNLRAEKRPRAVLLRWDPVDGAESYRVYRFSPEREDYFVIGSTLDPGYDDTTIDELIPEESSAHYVVSAANPAGESRATEALTVDITMDGAQRLPAPERLVVQKIPGYRNPLLRWSRVRDALSYQVERYYEDSADWRIVDSVYMNQWELKDGREIAIYRVRARRRTIGGYPSAPVTAGEFSVKAGAFADEAYRGEWIRDKEEGRSYTSRDDSPVRPEQRTAYRGGWYEAELFDFEKILSFYEEARRAEEEAFRAFKDEEQEAFQEFLDKEKNFGDQ